MGELKKTMKNDLNIDEVEDITEDMAELMDDFNEINDALGRNFATPDYIDEADLDAELEMLEDELEEETFETEDATPAYLQSNSMPAVPGKAVGEGEEEDATKVDEFGLPAVPN